MNPIEDNNIRKPNVYDCIAEDLNLHVRNQLENRIDLDETENYLLEAKDLFRICSNVFQFWQAKANIYPKLYKTAPYVLAIPATPAPPEQVFSQAGWCCGNDRNRNDESLINEVFLQCNKRFL